MNENKQYKKFHSQLVTFFQSYVDMHTLDECKKYYDFLEDHSQEDALSFALPMIEKYMDEFDHDLYDHIGCMVYHDGNDSMLLSLLQMQMNSKNADAIEYYKNLIESLIAGLQKTAFRGSESYSVDDLNELRKHLK